MTAPAPRSGRPCARCLQTKMPSAERAGVGGEGSPRAAGRAGPGQGGGRETERRAASGFPARVTAGLCGAQTGRAQPWPLAAAVPGCSATDPARAAAAAGLLLLSSGFAA